MKTTGSDEKPSSNRPLGLSLSVVIPTCHRASSLRKCLDSLLEQTYTNFEIVLVQCTQDSLTNNLVKEYSEKIPIRVITESGGLVPSMNAGLKASRGDIYIRTDDDIVADKRWLLEIEKTFHTDSDIGGVTGPTLVPSNRLAQRDVFMLLPSAGRISFPRAVLGAVYVNFFLEGKTYEVGRLLRSGAWTPGSNFGKILGMTQPITVDYLEACNLAVKRDLLRKLGGFDRGFKSLGDFSEMDMSFRLRRLGFKLIFTPKAIVHHMVSQSGVFTERQHASDIMENFLYFYFKNVKLDPVEGFARFLTYLMFLQAYWVYKSAMSGNLHYLGGLIGTLRGLAFGLKSLIGNSR